MDKIPKFHMSYSIQDQGVWYTSAELHPIDNPVNESSFSVNGLTVTIEATPKGIQLKGDPPHPDLLPYMDHRHELHFYNTPVRVNVRMENS